MLAGCASDGAQWRTKALGSLSQLEKEDAERLSPEAFRSIRHAVKLGENLLIEEDDDELADVQYRLAYQKSQVLFIELAHQRQKAAEEKLAKAREAEQRKLEEELKAAAELKIAQKKLEEQRKLEQQLQLKQFAAMNAHGKSTLGDTPAGQAAKERQQLPASYSVKRGESLPQIASRPDIYNDATLWPLIYRANRDQVRDPYQLWPGQVLKIPRSYSREDLIEAKRQASRRLQ